MKQQRSLLNWLLIFISSFMLSVIAYGLLQAFVFPVDSPLLNVLSSILLLMLYGVIVKLFEKHHVEDLPLRHVIQDMVKGFLTGAFFLGIVVGILMLIGNCRFSTGNTTVLAQLNAVTAFLAVAIGEEIIFRGVIFRLIDERWNTTGALYVSAIMFGTMHLSNGGATFWSAIAIAIEAGLLLGAAYKYSGNLWLPIGIHWAWNYFEGNVFGFAVSGGDIGSTILIPAVSGSEFITGGKFGIENSVVTVVLGLLLSIWFIYSYSKRTR